MLRLEQYVAGTANRLFPREAIELFCASIPEHDRSWKFPHDDCVMRLFQQIRLTPQGILSPLSFRDVVVEFQDRKWLLPLIALQRPPAGHHYLGSICLSVPEFAFPAARAQHLRVDLIKWRREDRLQQFVSSLVDHLLCRPPV